MKRTKEKDEKVDKSIYVKYSLVDRFSEYPNFTDILSLYVFYHKMGIQQKTNQPYATDTYCMKGLHIGSVRFYQAKKILRKLKLIEQIQVGRTRRKFGKPYIRLNDVRKEQEDRVKKSNKIENESMSPGPGKRVMRKRKMRRTTYPKGVCPYEHEFGKDYEQFNECFDCPVNDECEQENW